MYLQTDDRDDYFKSLGTHPPRRKIISFTLISPTGDVIFDNVQKSQIIRYVKSKYLNGKPSKYIWKSILSERGYQLLNN